MEIIGLEHGVRMDVFVTPKTCTQKGIHSEALVNCRETRRLLSTVALVAAPSAYLTIVLLSSRKEVQKTNCLRKEV